MLNVAWCLIVLVAGFGIAHVLCRPARINFRDEFESLIVKTSLGLGLTAYVVFIIGSVNLLYKGVMIGVIGVLFTVSLYPFIKTAQPLLLKTVSRIQRMSGLAKAIAVLAAGVLILSLSGALAPPTGQDELCYHLVQPKNYVREHAIYAVPYSINALWPYLMHMLFTLGLVLGDAALAKLFHFAAFVLCGGLITAVLRRFVHRDAALLGGLVYLMTPGTFIQASFAYVDNALALYGLGTVFMTLLFIQERRMGWAVLAGIFLGFSASTKLIGLFMLPVAGAMVLADAAGTRNTARLGRGTAVLVLSALAAGGLWYVRSWMLAGNPVYPFYPQVFGGHGFQDATYVDSHGRGTGLGAFLILLWDVTVHPDWFGGEHIGPLYLAVLPLIVLVRPIPSAIRSLMAASLTYAAIWFIVDPNIRFFYPALGFLAAICGFVIYRLWVQNVLGLRPVLAAAGLLILLIQAAYAPYHFKDAAKLLIGGSRADYLAKHERSFEAAEVINRHLKEGDRIISTGEIRGFYFDHSFTLAGDFGRMTHYTEKVSSSRELKDFLKTRGFTHVLSASFEEYDPAQEEPYSLRRVIKEPELRRGNFKEALIVRTMKYVYELYEIL